MRALLFRNALSNAFLTLVDLAGAFVWGLLGFRIGHWIGVSIGLFSYFILWAFICFGIARRRLSRVGASQGGKRLKHEPSTKNQTKKPRSAKTKRVNKGKRPIPSDMLAKEQVTHILASVEAQLSQEYMQERISSESESDRLKFCLSLVNLISVIWWVNMSKEVTEEHKVFLNDLLDEFIDHYQNNPSHFQVKDLIPWADEQKLLASRLGIKKTNMTNLRTILPIIYENRLRPYYQAFGDRAVAMAKRKTLFIDPVIKLFLLHATGKQTIEDKEYALKLTIDMLPRQTALGEFILKAVDGHG